MNIEMELLHFFFTGSYDFSNIAGLETVIRDNSINYTLISSVILIVLVAVAGFIKKPNEFVKIVLFILMVGIISFNTVYLAGSTIYKNQRSITKGPVHWHADIDVFNCGQEVNLRDPKGWSNKIGTPTFHEHNDKRLHVEGVVLNQDDVTLGHFFKVIGGKLDTYGMTVPVNEGDLMLNHGDLCNGAPGLVQVFVYKTEGDQFWQEKVMNPQDYVLSPYSAVPAGDCIIVEFDSMIKEKTERICQSYALQKHLGKLTERR